MGEHSFELTIDGGLDEERVGALYEAGCDDMTFQGAEAGPASATVHRDAPTLVDAVLSAVRSIEGVPGLTVLSLEDQDPDEAQIVAAINATLVVRRLATRLSEQERRVLGTLAAAG